MGSQQMKRRRRNLFAVDPYCWYCGCEVREYKLPHGGRQQPDQATVEHLVSKRHPMRGSQHGLLKVLACYDCNVSRGHWTGRLLQEDQRAWQEQYEAWKPTIGELVASA